MFLHLFASMLVAKPISNFVILPDVGVRPSPKVPTTEDMDDWELKLLGKKGAAPFTPSGKLSLKVQLDLQMYSESLGFLNFSLDLDPLLILVWQLLFNMYLN